MKDLFFKYYFCGIFKYLNNENEFIQIGKDVGEKLSFLLNFKREKDLDSLIYKIVFVLLPNLYESERFIEKATNRCETSSVDRNSSVDGASNVDRNSSVDGASNVDRNSSVDGASSVDRNSNVDGASNIGNTSNIDNISNINQPCSTNRIIYYIYESNQIFKNNSNKKNNPFCPNSIIAGIIQSILEISGFNCEVMAYNCPIKENRIIYTVSYPFQ